MKVRTKECREAEANPTEEQKLIRLPHRGGGDGRKGLAEEIEEFLIDRQARNATPSTMGWYRRCLRCWQEYLETQEIRSTVQVQPSTVRRFLVLLGEAHTPGGVSTLFTGVKAFLNWYREEHNLTNWNPLARIEMPKRPKDPLSPVALVDVAAMVAACPMGSFNGDRDRALLLFLLDTGVRHQELTNLTMGQVNLETGSVLVRQGKGRKTRTVFCGVKTRGALDTYMRHRTGLSANQILWVKEDGEPLSKCGIRQVVRRRAKAAGVTEPGLHAFRRAFAVNCLRNGMDVVCLQRLMGHSELSTVLRYLALVDDDLRRAHQQFGVVDSLEKEGTL